MSTFIAPGARALALAQPSPACFAFNSYPPPLPLPPLTPSALSLSTLDENAVMPSSISSRQSLSSCGASVRYTPRRRNALVPLPLLPPVPPHVVVKRIAGVVCTLFLSPVTASHSTSITADALSVCLMTCDSKNTGKNPQYIIQQQ